MPQQAFPVGGCSGAGSPSPPESSGPGQPADLSSTENPHQRHLGQKPSFPAAPRQTTSLDTQTLHLPFFSSTVVWVISPPGLLPAENAGFSTNSYEGSGAGFPLNLSEGVDNIPSLSPKHFLSFLPIRDALCKYRGIDFPIDRGGESFIQL